MTLPVQGSGCFLTRPNIFTSEMCDSTSFAGLESAVSTRGYFVTEKRFDFSVTRLSVTPKMTMRIRNGSS